MVRSSPTVHCWAPLPLQAKSWTWVPLALLVAATSTHLPPKPTIVPVVAAVALVRPTTPRATTAAAVAVTLTYRRSVLLRPGFTGLPFGSAVGVRQGRRQTWFVPPKQSQICNRVPSAALAP